MINAFATFLLLSFSKYYLCPVFHYIQCEDIKTTNDHAYRSFALFYNCNINIDMKIYHSMCLAFLFQPICPCIPTIILCCYQFIKGYMYSLVFIIVSIIINKYDAFQGHYKDGTDGTYNWRFLAGLYLLLRVVIVYSVYRHKLFPKNIGPSQVLHYVFVTVTVIIAFVRSCKRLIHNLTETLLLVLLMYMRLSVSVFQRIYHSQGDRLSKDHCSTTYPTFFPCYGDYL